MNILPKFVTLMMTLVALPTPLYAEVSNQTKLIFDIKTESLLKNDIHYSYAIGDAREILEKSPDLIDIDAIGVFKNLENKVQFIKSAYVIKKAVGFFDHKRVINPQFLGHTHPSEKFSAVDENTFKISKSGIMPEKYKTHYFYDSDDVTTLPNSVVTQSMMNSKRLDIITQGANASVFQEIVDYSKYAVKGMSITHYVPLTEKKTLVVTYQLTILKKHYALEKVLRPIFLKEVKELRDLTDSFEE